MEAAAAYLVPQTTPVLQTEAKLRAGRASLGLDWGSLLGKMNGAWEHFFQVSTHFYNHAGTRSYAHMMPVPIR